MSDGNLFLIHLISLFYLFFSFSCCPGFTRHFFFFAPPSPSLHSSNFSVSEASLISAILLGLSDSFYQRNLNEIWLALYRYPNQCLQDNSFWGAKLSLSYSGCWKSCSTCVTSFIKGCWPKSKGWIHKAEDSCKEKIEEVCNQAGFFPKDWSLQSVRLTEVSSSNSWLSDSIGFSPWRFSISLSCLVWYFHLPKL